jgi:YHS domain-containing protein
MTSKEIAMHRWFKSLPAFLVALLAGAGAWGQGPARPPHVALKGYDPVAYFTDGKPTKGAPEINYDFDEGRYLFSSAAHRTTFTANPDRYSPQFDGLCATGLAMGMKAEADPTVWKIVDGKLYVFSSPKALAMAEKDPTLLDRSRKAWQERK